jgi:hypothetical protein
MKELFKAKNISLTGIIIAVLIAICFNLFSLLLLNRIPSQDEQKSIIILCRFIIIAFSPVYVSIFLDKILRIKK